MVQRATGVLLLWLLATLASSTSPDTPASRWNGHVDPGTDKPEPFRPYFVPKGSESIDDKSSALTWSGAWSTLSSSDYIDGSCHTTTSNDAQVKLTFNGTGVECFGNTGPKYGSFNVYLDGKYVQQISGYDTKDRIQQRLWQQYNLPSGSHELVLVNVLASRSKKSPLRLDIDAFVVIGSQGSDAIAATPGPSSQLKESLLGSDASSPQWTLSQNGNTGVSAMQLAVISPTRALLVDKVEHNPATIDGHPGWAAIYDFNENRAYPIHITSNSFCAGGTFLSNGTMINVGGNPVVEDHTNSADFGDTNGLQGIRILNNCPADQSGSPSNCILYEDPSRFRMASPRWYNTVLRLDDGSAMIIGGSSAGGWINNQSVNNPTYEFFPPKGNGKPVHSQFLVDTLNANLFPIAFLLPDGRVFMAANRGAMIYDWKNDQEQRLPDIPNSVRVTYPMAATALLLPLDPSNNYTPEILICGGSTVKDTMPSYEIDSQDPASAQCSRMVLTDDGISAGWQVEQMPDARIMPDAVLLPTGNVFIVNGGKTGVSGYGNVKNQVGASNCDNPAFTPTMYYPYAQDGSRFDTTGLPTSDIPRLYHSVATLTPDGHLLIAGSNPNLDRSTVKYQTEYRVEHVYPPYMSGNRPNASVPGQLLYGQQYTINMSTPIASDASEIKVSLMDLGFVTHSVHANSRLVYLQSTVSDDRTSLTVTAPPTTGVYPPGPGWVFVVIDGIPSVATMVMIGDGSSPP